MMKQKIYILGLISSLIVFTGTVFKINHYPGAAIMLITGISSLVVLFLPLALMNHYRAYGNSNNRVLYIVTYITCLVVFTAMLFKLMHWPKAGILMTIALPFPYLVFLPVFIGVTSQDKSFNIYNTVYVLLLLALNSVFSALLSLNVTSERVTDSYQLSRNYINQQKGLELLAGEQKETALTIDIDQAIKSIEDCRNKVLGLDGKTTVDWKNNPGNLSRPDIRGSAANGMGADGRQASIKLQHELDQLIKTMAVTPGYELLARNAHDILNFKVSDADSAEWYQQVFNDFLAWVLIYLDALESNLYLIKTTSAS